MTTATLRDTTMLVRLRIRLWEGRRRSKELEDETEQNHNVTGVVSVRKALLPSAVELTTVKSKATRVREVFHGNTLPWMDEGQRILTSAAYPVFSNLMNQAIEEYNTACDDFIDAYPYRKSEARSLLNGLYHEGDYPREDELREKFGADVIVLPFPDVEDFRVDLSDNVRQALQDTARAAIEEQIEDAQAALWNKLAEGLEFMRGKLDDDKAVIRVSALEKIIQTASRAPALALSSKDDVNGIASEIVKLLSDFDPKVGSGDRTAAKRDEVDDLLRRVRGFAA